MNIIIFLASLFLLHFIEAGEVEVKFEKLDIQSNIAFLNGTEFNGKAINYFKDSSIINETRQYKNGLLNGLVCHYFKNTQLKRHLSYVNGKLNGISKTWSMKGTLLSIQNYKDNLAHGKGKDFYENGKIKNELLFFKGIPDGWQKSWHSNGTKKYEILIDKGKILQKKVWDKNGEIIFSQ